MKKMTPKPENPRPMEKKLFGFKLGIMTYAEINISSINWGTPNLQPNIKMIARCGD